MATTESSSVQALNVNFYNDFYRIAKQPLKYDLRDVFYKTVSNSTKNEYVDILGDPAWIEYNSASGRTVKNLKADGVTITNKAFESTVEIAVDTFDDNLTGIYTNRGAGMANQYRKLVQKSCGDSFKTTANSYDGVAFYSKLHKYYLTADATGTASTQSNVLAPSSGTPSSAWYLIAADDVSSPFIFQNRKNPQIVSLINPTDYNVVNNDMYKWAGKARFGVGNCHHTNIIKATVPLNQANYELAFVQLLGMKNYGGGQPLGLIPTHLVIQSTQFGSALKILNASLLPSTAGTNVFENSVKLIVSDYIA